MRADRVVVIGAGIGGLVAALDLAVAGAAVTVVERASAPGGKMREVAVAGTRMDAGPTVFTMRWVFEEVFANAGTSLDRQLTLRPATVLARHAWSERERLDLFADISRSADAIAAFAGPAEASGYRAFCDRAARIYRTLETPFIRAPRQTPLSLAAGTRTRDLLGISPFSTLWRALGEHFADPRLRQLFGRYATYCGSSPFLAPATLMLVAHVEQDGVWLVEGGMHRLAASLAALASEKGVAFRYDAHVSEIEAGPAGVSGVRLASGERIAADAVVANADVAAVGGGAFGRAASSAIPATPAADRSLSALTWNLVARAEGFPLLRHTVFFSGDYPAEFDFILRRGRVPDEPTVYVCAQDRDDAGAATPEGPERLLCLVNAPPTGDRDSFGPTEIARCEERTFRLLRHCGLIVHRTREATLTTSPADFERLFPRTGGALYGPASHGWMASFKRAGARTKVPNLYLAGGSTHPGPGVPMAALSGRMAAATLLADLASTRRSRAAAIAGGMSTR